jgi:type II secretory pathway pseudopilin PulG
MGQNKQSQAGFTIIESLISVMVVALIGLAVLSAVVGGLRFTQLSKEQALAYAIANEKMEELRNMPYDDLATVQGTIYPPGNIVDEETIDRENVRFTIKIRIDFVDDPFDGDAQGTIPDKPVDLFPYDYKKIEISVIRPNRANPIAKLVTNVGARAAETDRGTGILLITVLDAQGQAVAGATVTVQNLYVIPPVSIVTQTDINGRVMIPSLPPENQNRYHVEATKAGYSTDQTYPRTAQNPNALQPDLNVLVQQITSQTLVIDQVSTLAILVRDVNESLLGGLELTISSDKLAYTNPDTPKNQWTEITNSDGQIVLQNVEFDSYGFTVPNPYRICSSSPFQKVPVPPNSTVTATLHLTLSNQAPIITRILPTTAQTGSAITLTVTGDDFDQGATVVLKRQGSADIVANPVTVQPNGDELSATFDLSGAATGVWDLVVTNPNGDHCPQPAALTVQ